MSISFLSSLLSAVGPSSDEAIPARIWRAEAENFADDVSVDINGNSFALLKGNELRVLLDGHIDEIGLMVSHIDESGMLWVSAIGGWDVPVLIGQRVRILGKNQEVLGAIGRKPAHLLEAEEREKAGKIRDLWVDIGAKDRAEAQEHVRVGSTAVIEAPVLQFPNNRIVSRAIDDRIGAYTVLEALRLLSQDRAGATVAAVASTDEEISGSGALNAAFSFNPHVAITVDVTHSTDQPNVDKREHGEVNLGGGPVFSRGASNNARLYDMLIETAERENIPYSLQITSQYTGTNADKIVRAGSGIASAVISIPNRYMHSPNEMIQMDDVENAAKLIASLVRSLTPETDFVPR
jgi:endoglucanase